MCYHTIPHHTIQYNRINTTYYTINIPMVLGTTHGRKLKSSPADIHSGNDFIVKYFIVKYWSLIQCTI